MSKEFKIKVFGKEITITQNTDGTFNKPDFMNGLKSKGTNLKPAYEHWILARKPLSEKTIVENCIKHGTGAIDIDGTRIPINKNDDVIAKNPHTASKGTDAYTQNCYGKYNPTKPTNYKDVSEKSGRFPANICVSQRIDIAINDLLEAKSILLDKKIIQN